MTNESVQEIVKDARAAHNDLSVLEQDLQAEIDQIDFDAFRARRDLTPQEAQRRTQLAASQNEVRDARAVLVLFNLSRLDSSADVAALALRMSQINRGLADDFERLNRIVKLAATVAKVTDGVAKVTAKIAKLALGGVAPA
jgi:hypothetical protein